MKYRSKIGIIWIASCACMIGLTIKLLLGIDFNSSSWWIGCLTMGLGDALFINLTFDTWYTFHDDYLELKSGVFSYVKIPYQDIISFKETHNPLASIGLSMDRIDLIFLAQNGGNGKDEALISPVRKQEFLSVLEEKTRKKRKV